MPKSKESDLTILVNVLIKRVQTYGKVGLLPFLWNPKTNSIEKRDPDRAKMLFCIFMVLCILATTLQGLQSWRCYESACPPQFQVRLSALCFIYFCIMLLYPGVYKNRDEFMSLIGELYLLQRHLSSTLTENIPSKKLKWFIQVFRRYPAFIATLTAITNITDPSRPSALTSLLPNASKLGIGMRIGLASVQFTLLYTMATVFVFHLCWDILYLHLMAPAVVNLRILNEELGSEATLRKLQHKYNALQILETTAAKCFSFWMQFITYGLTLVIVFYIYMSLALGNPTVLVAAFFLSGSTVAILRKAGEVHHASAVMLKSWNHVGKPEWFPKYRKACRPIEISVGSWFFLDRHYFLTFIDVVTQSTISFILYMDSV